MCWVRMCWVRMWQSARRPVLRSVSSLLFLVVSKHWNNSSGSCKDPFTGLAHRVKRSSHSTSSHQILGRGPKNCFVVSAAAEQYVTCPAENTSDVYVAGYSVVVVDVYITRRKLAEVDLANRAGPALGQKHRLECLFRTPQDSVTAPNTLQRMMSIDIALFFAVISVGCPKSHAEHAISFTVPLQDS